MKIFSQTKNFVTSLFIKSHENHESNKTILGGILCFFAFGGVMTWGNLNIYFFSYFKNKSNLTNPSQNNLILSIIAIPLAIISVFSIQISEKIGFKKIIMATSLIFSLSVMFSCLFDNIYFFSAFYNILPALALGLSMNPILFTVWATNPENKGKISGNMFAVFQLSGLFFSFLGTLIVNPENRPAEIKVLDDNNNEISYYGQEITKNVPKMLFIFGVIYFLFGVLGACLMKTKESTKFSGKNNQNENESEKKQATTSPIQLEMGTTNNSKYEVFIEEKQNNSKKENEEESERSECPNIKTGIKTRTFAILFINSALVVSFGLYLNINFKSFSLTRLNNDYYVTTLYLLNMICGGLGRFFWGFMVDKYDFKKIFILLEIMVFVNASLFPFMRNNFLFCFFIFCIAFFDGGLISIMGPGLITIYGLNVGSKLLPIKGLAFFLGLLFCPLIGYLFEKSLGIEKVLFILGFLNIIGVILSLFIKMKYNWYVSPK